MTNEELKNKLILFAVIDKFSTDDEKKEFTARIEEDVVKKISPEEIETFKNQFDNDWERLYKEDPDFFQLLLKIDSYPDSHTQEIANQHTPKTKEKSVGGVTDLKTLKKKYIGTDFNTDVLNDCYYSMDITSGKIRLELPYYEGRLKTYVYFMTVLVNVNGKISKIYAPKCMRLVSHCGLNCKYANYRMDELGYSRLDEILRAEIL